MAREEGWLAAQMLWETGYPPENTDIVDRMAVRGLSCSVVWKKHFFSWNTTVRMDRIEINRLVHNEHLQSTY